MKKKNWVRRIFNRLLHSAARSLPGATSLRPFLHRMRGVRIEGKVFIGEDVYIENEYPEFVEIHDQAQVGLRTVIIAHTRGPGKVVIEKEAYIGANTVIAGAPHKTLRIGEGAVVGASSVVTSDVPARTFVRPDPPRAFARVRRPLATAKSYDEFLLGLTPIKIPKADLAQRRKDAKNRTS